METVTKVLFEAFGHTVAKQEINQDAFYCNAGLGVYAVCDGVGGSNKADLASSLVVKFIDKFAQDLPPIKQRNIQEVSKALVAKIYQANSALIFSANGSQTTLSIGVLCPGPDGLGVVTLNVGDSRIYGFKPLGREPENKTEDRDQLRKLTIDDSWSNDPRLDSIDNIKDLTESLDFAFRRRNYITRALGTHGLNELSPNWVLLDEFEGLLFTTDGVHDNLARREIVHTLLDYSRWPRTVVEKLIDLSFHRYYSTTTMRSKADDITAIYVSLGRIYG